METSPAPYAGIFGYGRILLCPAGAAADNLTTHINRVHCGVLVTVLRRIVAATTVGVLISLFLVTFGSPSQAAWYCGDTCNRTDPNSYYVTPYQTCAMDAQTKSEVYNSAHGLTLQLRYSPYCRTIWGRIYGGNAQNYYVGLQRIDGPGD